MRSAVLGHHAGALPLQMRRFDPIKARTASFSPAHADSTRRAVRHRPSRLSAVRTHQGVSQSPPAREQKVKLLDHKVHCLLTHPSFVVVCVCIFNASEFAKHQDGDPKVCQVDNFLTNLILLILFFSPSSLLPFLPSFPPSYLLPTLT